MTDHDETPFDAKLNALAKLAPQLNIEQLRVLHESVDPDARSVVQLEDDVEAYVVNLPASGNIIVNRFDAVLDQLHRLPTGPSPAELAEQLVDTLLAAERLKVGEVPTGRMRIIQYGDPASGFTKIELV